MRRILFSSIYGSMPSLIFLKFVVVVGINIIYYYSFFLAGPQTIFIYSQFIFIYIFVVVYFQIVFNLHIIHIS